MNLVFCFSSSLTSYHGNKWNERAFKKAIKPLRDAIHELDGISGVKIFRECIDIEFSESIITADNLEAELKALLQQLAIAHEHLFPYLDADEPIALTVRTVQESPRSVYFYYNTSVVAAWEETTFGQVTAPIGTALRDFDGIAGHKVFTDCLQVNYHPYAIDVVALQLMLEAMLNGLASDHPELFPRRGTKQICLTPSRSPR